MRNICFKLSLIFVISIVFSAKSGSKTPQQTAIENEINRLKHQDNSANTDKIISLNAELEALTGNNISHLSSNGEGGFRFSGQPVPFEGNTDFIQNTRIFNNIGNVHALAAAIEQRGATAGKIWLMVLYSDGPNVPDSFKVFYSVTAGQSWVLYVPGNVRPYDKVSYDDLDMELVENFTGQKYLWVTFGYRQNGGIGAWKAGGFALQVPNLNGTFFNELSWPGSDSTKRYYNIRITSDNARYAATPYLYIACSFDSADANGNRVNTQKFARCLNPYSISNITFSYMGSRYYWYDAANYQRTLYTDIAYFNNGGADSIEVSYDGALDSTKIYFAKSDINGNAPVTSSGAGGPVGGNNPNDYKTFARLSSNGNDNGSVICVFRQFTAGNWNVKWYRTDNYGNFANLADESILWGSSVNPNYQPDIVGVRNGNTHYVAFTTSASEDSLHYISVNSLGGTNHVRKMNYYSASEELGPKAVFRYANNDSCLVAYSENGPLNLISASGCSGEPIGIIGNQIPRGFSLQQNYPNPFNPLTIINYELRVPSFAKLALFDILGREISTLVNEKQQAGMHTFNFDGSKFPSGVYFYKLTAETGDEVVFSDARKMALIR